MDFFFIDTFLIEYALLVINLMTLMALCLFKNYIISYGVGALIFVTCRYDYLRVKDLDIRTT